SYLAQLVPRDKRTLSNVILNLPNHGIGGIFARDTWHPESKRYWEILEVVTAKDSSAKVDAYGYLYYQGEKTHPFPKRVHSVWRYGWYWKPKPEQEKLLQPLKERYNTLVDMGIIDPSQL
uniref:mS34 n=1 Tax=Polytomella magna TaxID=353565 RepID=UPI002240E512|nr:Chain Bz, mS34 [Polytomella magna]8APN_Bz Chain Bz, mS34 [Polytomella magna]8APO_Bz Chain Bz, mS34 [Polytomella magna]